MRSREKKKKGEGRKTITYTVRKPELNNAIIAQALVLKYRQTSSAPPKPVGFDNDPTNARNDVRAWIAYRMGFFFFFFHGFGHRGEITSEILKWYLLNVIYLFVPFSAGTASRVSRRRACVGIRRVVRKSIGMRCESNRISGLPMQGVRPLKENRVLIRLIK